MADPIIHVDPAELHVPPGRIQGADPGKLARQISAYGTAFDTMPPLQLVLGSGGRYRINNGVTRATRIAKFRPGELVPAVVIHRIPHLNVARLPRIKDVLP
jgi:hypothetical protein